MTNQMNRHVIRFQSTLPAGGATSGKTFTQDQVTNFNPRSPRGERLLATGLVGKRLKFQSTLPAGGATMYRCIV